jgi:hypothetical protein
MAMKAGVVCWRTDDFSAVNKTDKAQAQDEAAARLSRRAAFGPLRVNP